jgi:hypothetical protein
MLEAQWQCNILASLTFPLFPLLYTSSVISFAASW